MSRRQRRAGAQRPAHWRRNPARDHVPALQPHPTVTADDPRAVMIDEASAFIRKALDAHAGPPEQLIFLIVHRDHEAAVTAPAIGLIHRFPSGNLLACQPVAAVVRYALRHGHEETAVDFAQAPPVVGCAWCFVLAPDLPPLRAALAWVDRMPAGDPSGAFFTRGGTT